ncbi:hypothetical protein JZU69_00025, partial [bacterium]|nr:hypothetical protein [bacterium]
AGHGINSEPVRITIPQRGAAARPEIDPAAPARWTQSTRLDDAGAVWDFIARLEQSPTIRAHAIGLTAESADGHQNVEYSGALEAGYDAAALKAVAQRLLAARASRYIAAYGG